MNQHFKLYSLIPCSHVFNKTSGGFRVIVYYFILIYMYEALPGGAPGSLVSCQRFLIVFYELDVTVGNSFDSTDSVECC